MNNFNFGMRNSGEGLGPDNHYGRKNVASSIYSGGPGPAEEMSHSASMYGQDALRNPFHLDQPRYNPLNQEHPRSSALLNINDPVAMHLLMETAMLDSSDYEILSFEEVEKLKKESTLLRTRIDAVQRKLALENKLRDAAQSLNRLYSTKGRPGSGDGAADSSSQSPKRHRRSLLGSRGSNSDEQTKANDEVNTSVRKIEELTLELSRLQIRQEENQKRILQHTAGILQMTHKGLKKNVRKTELPRSPESMASLQHQSLGPHDGADEFDERSLYQIPDYVNDYGKMNGLANGHNPKDLEDTQRRVVELSNRLHSMILQTDPEERVEAPPGPPTGAVAQTSQQIQAHLAYLDKNLDVIEAVQARTVQQAQKSTFASEDKLDDINVKLHSIFEKTNQTGHSPSAIPSESRGKSIHTQLAFSAMVLERLDQRLDKLVEQKDILTRQIQQQRELNSKSDAQRDAQIQDLTEELAETKRLHAMNEQESQHSRDQLNLMMEQLDQARQENVLLDQQGGLQVDKVLQAEKKSRREAEEGFLADIRTAQNNHSQTKADLAKMQNEFEIRGQQHTRELNSTGKAKEELEIELQRWRGDMEALKKVHGETMDELEHARSETQDVEGELVRLQTELTMARAELDGAYGSRAQRAADVSMNPAVKKEMDTLREGEASLRKQLEFLNSQHESKGAGSAELQNKVNNLQKELRDTIEDYELMTKASIEFEKERDHMEATIDTMRERCEALETQVSEEKVKWLGAKNNAPSETTSTMVLKNEFKKMMRDTRAENVKALRVSLISYQCFLHS
jgi:chromosome segregation ATPase